MWMWLRSGPLSVGFLGGCSQAVGWTVVSYEGSTREGSASRLIHAVVGRIQFLASCWTACFSSLLAVGWRPASVL